MRKSVIIIFVVLCVVATIGYIGFRSIGEDKPVATLGGGIPDVNKFEVVTEGTIALVKPSGSGTANVTYNHNLGYLPAVIAYGYTDSDITFGGYNLLPLVSTDTAGTHAGKIYYQASFYVDENVIGFVAKTPNLTSPSAGYYNENVTLNIKFYLLRQTANK